MIVQVNQELCAGCGACVEVCSARAIHMQDFQAVINASLCTGCKACMDICPNAAIRTVAIQEPEVSIMTLPALDSRQNSTLAQAGLPGTELPAHRGTSLAGAALAFLGGEVAPRLIDGLISALERKLAQPRAAAVSPFSLPSSGIPSQSRGKQRKARHRGGRSGNRNFMGRR